MDRFDRYSIYLMSWGRGSAPPSPVWPPDPAFADAALASGIGVYQHAHGAPLLSIDGFDRCVAVLVDGESDDEPDVGPSARDKRELEDAQVRLRQLIAAGGVTDTGDRWLFDAAADEIVRLRGGADPREEREALRRDLSDALARLDFVRATLETPAGEMTERAAGRVMREQAALMAEVARLRKEVDDLERKNLHLECAVGGELRQAKEALEQARAKVDELRRDIAYGAERMAAERERGAAEMRERAPALLQRMKSGIRDVLARAALQDGADAIRALPLDGALEDHPQRPDIVDARCAATARALLAMGVSAMRAEVAARIAEEEGGTDPEATHAAVLQLAKRDAAGFMGDQHETRLELRSALGRGPDVAPTAAPGLTEDERAALRRRGYIEHAGTWKHMWAGPAYDPAKPEDLAELRRDIAENDDLDKAELSAEDAETLRGAGWTERPGHWDDARGGGWVKNAPNLETFRVFAAELRGDGPTCGAANYSRPKAPPADALSPGDVEALRGAGWEEVLGGRWRDPADGIIYNIAMPYALGRLRERAAEVRAKKAPPAAHMGPGKATGEESAAGGSGSVAEEQGAAQGRRGAAGTVRLGIAVAVQPDGTVHAWRLDGSSLGTSPAPGQDAAPHGGDRGQGLPKPDEVKIGQRWSVDFRDINGTIKEDTVEATGDELARLCGAHGVKYVTKREMLTSPRFTFLGGPSPQDPSPKRDDATARLDARIGGLIVDVGRTARDPARSSAATADTSEPTARDAVAGMLLRHGYYDAAEDLAGGESPGVVIVDMDAPTSGKGRACIAALEVLASGEMRVFVSRWTDGAAILDSFEARDAATRERLGARDDEATQDAAERVVEERDRERADHVSAATVLKEVGLILETGLGRTYVDAARARMKERLYALRDVGRLTIERDEARAEATALWERIRELSALWTGLMRTSIGDRAEARDAATKAYHGGRIDVASLFVIVLCRMLGADAPTEAHGPCHAPPSCETTAEMRPAEDIAREMVSDARQSDFSMESRATLFGILVVPALQVDVDDLRRHLARLITRSRAEGLRASGRERVKAWPDNLPPEMAKVYEELKDADPKGRPLSDAAAQAEEPSGMRIEKRDDGEWLVGAGAVNDCDEIVMIGDRCWPCFYHMNGEHITTGTLRDGAELIMARWPIASVPERDEPSRVAIPGADDIHLFSIGPEHRIDLIAPKWLDPEYVMRTVAELLGLPVPPEETQEQIEARAYNHGFREGERRAGNELEALRAKVNSLAVQLDDIGDVFGGEDGRNDPVRFACARMDELRDLRSKYAEWQRMFGVAEPEKVTGTYAAMQRARDEGVEEGERRAKVKAAELISEWEGKRLATLALRRSAEPGTETWARRDSSALIRRSCSLDLSLMFGVELPPDGSGDDGAEEGERRSLQARLEAERAAVRADLDAGKRDASAPSHEKASPSADWTAGPDGRASEAFQRIVLDIARLIVCAEHDRTVPAKMADQIMRCVAHVHGLAPSDARPAEEPIAAPDRETLGRAVHKVARVRAQEIGLEGRPWDEIGNRDRETACLIGERLFAMGVRWELEVAGAPKGSNAPPVIPRLFPVVPGPLAALAERIEGVIVKAFAEPADGERRGPAAARWVLRLVDEHLQGASVA